MDDQLPKLPSKFQSAFDLARTKADLKYATRADPVAHDPRFAGPHLHRGIRVQEEFFAYCTEARSAFRAGAWSLAQLNVAVEAAWPVICDSYFDREPVGTQEDAR